MSIDLFARVPLRAHQALREGDLTLSQFAIISHLCGTADYRTQTYVATLRALADDLQWPRSDDMLRRDLAALRDAEWIAYEVRPRQRRPYVIKLTGAAIRTSAEATAAPDVSLMRQSTTAPPQSLEVANAAPARREATVELPTRDSPIEQNRTEEEENRLSLSSESPPSEPCEACGVEDDVSSYPTFGGVRLCPSCGIERTSRFLRGAS